MNHIMCEYSPINLQMWKWIPLYLLLLLLLCKCAFLNQSFEREMFFFIMVEFIFIITANQNIDTVLWMPQSIPKWHIPSRLIMHFSNVSSKFHISTSNSNNNNNKYFVVNHKILIVFRSFHPFKFSTACCYLCMHR